MVTNNNFVMLPFNNYSRFYYIYIILLTLIIFISLSNNIYPYISFFQYFMHDFVFLFDLIGHTYLNLHKVNLYIYIHQ